MIYTDPLLARRLSPEQMRALIKPCPICGAKEPELAPGIFGNVKHDYSIHFPDRPHLSRNEAASK